MSPPCFHSRPTASFVDISFRIEFFCNLAKLIRDIGCSISNLLGKTSNANAAPAYPHLAKLK